jgi:hypothetical protein
MRLCFLPDLAAGRVPLGRAAPAEAPSVMMLPASQRRLPGRGRRFGRDGLQVHILQLRLVRVGKCRARMDEYLSKLPGPVRGPCRAVVRLRPVGRSLLGLVATSDEGKQKTLQGNRDSFQGTLLASNAPAQIQAQAGAVLKNSKGETSSSRITPSLYTDSTRPNPTG